ncbi:hypothetical protein AZH53_07835 [Methanomicrobiaceae archaeon CYW5]|uniref:helix-turn-helix transcriptional regulator n=1 Tax=Methanovulcanius yangii TaxID=1789227 RepID=UPI0029CA733C|nr:transcriptional regulator FilR1 domain-containing protein [Methanovulcanius yangii]MBT8508313.1 hypothetical protein [Methanovulcanius yangii]
MREIAGFIHRFGPEAQSLFRSGLCIRIVLALHDGPAALPALTRRIRGSTSGSIHRNLKRLVEEKLVEEEDGRYRLTNAGTILVRRLGPLIRTFRDPAQPPESSMDLSRRYHEYESGMNAILLSGHALTILCALREGPCTRDALRDLTGARSTTLRTRIRLLTGSGHLREDDDGFSLTTRGMEVADQVLRFLRTVALLSRQKDFWNDHNIEKLPASAVETLYHLTDVNVDFDTPESIPTKIIKYFEMVATAHRLFGISEWTAPQLAEEYTKRVLARKDLDLIVTEKILHSMLEEPSLEILQKYTLYPDFRLHVISDRFWCGMTIADSNFAIKFYSKDGQAHTNARLKASETQEAVEWGMALFGYFKARSTPFEDYLRYHPHLLNSNSLKPDSTRMQ